MTEPDPLLISVAQASRIAGLPVRALYEILERPAAYGAPADLGVRFGQVRRIWVRRSVLLSWLNGGRWLNDARETQ